jgi:Tol biopolymer transport system component
MPPAHSSQLSCWPVFLPGGDRFLYFVNRTPPGDTPRNGIYAGSLSSTESRLVSLQIDGNVQFARGNLFFAADGGLHAQPFDPERIEFTDGRTPVVQHELEIWERVWFHSGFSVSESGIAVFQSRNDFGPELVWSTVSGDEYGRIAQHGFWEPAISPDGRFVAVSSDELHDGRWCICIHDLDRGVTTRLTEGGHDWHPSWSLDGASLVYDSTEGHSSCTFEIPTDGSGPPRLLLEPGSACAHKSADGSIVFMRIEGGRPVLYVYLPEEGRTVSLGPGAEPQFSPDGRWIAFTEPGGGGIVVRSRQSPSRRFRVSPGRAAQPRWSRDGRQLFYVAADKSLMTVSFDCHSGQPGPPRKCFSTRIVGASLIGFQYDVGPDGRVLINSLPGHLCPLTMLTGL